MHLREKIRDKTNGIVIIIMCFVFIFTQRLSICSPKPKQKVHFFFLKKFAKNTKC